MSHPDLQWCNECTALFAGYEAAVAARDIQRAGRLLARFDAHRDGGHPRGNRAGKRRERVR